IFKIARNIRYIIFGIFYVSTALSLFFLLLFPSVQFAWGGALGDFISKWLLGFIGTVGTVLLWLVIGFVYIVWRYNINLKPKRNSGYFKRLKNEKADDDEVPDKEQEVKTQSLGNDAIKADESADTEMKLFLKSEESDESSNSVNLEINTANDTNKASNT